MIKTFEHIWKDVRQGKHIGLYVIICFAIIVPILKISGVADHFDILPMILAVLGFMLAKKLHKLWILEGLRDSYNKQEKKLESIIAFQQKPPLNILPTWHSPALLKNIESTQKNIVMVQSWFPDASILADTILNSCKKTDSKIHVELYLLDPERSLGAQRWLEVNNKIDETDIEKFLIVTFCGE